MNATQSEVANAIRTIVNSSGEVLGSRLALQLKAVVPEWSAEVYGVRSLRDFIAQHVQGVQIAGRSGMDVVYASSTLSTRVGASPAIEAEPWRIWVSPNSPYVLAVNAEIGAVVGLPRSSETPNGHKRLEPATSAEHRSIAAAFAEQTEASVKELLAEVATLPDGLWWQRWQDEVRASGLLPEWNAYRHENLRSKLRGRLAELGVDASVVDRAYTTICGSTVVGRRTPSQTREPLRHSGESTFAREIALRVIGRMTDQDIRELRLPLGLVLDALADSKG